jgi:hypothetical protein
LKAEGKKTNEKQQHTSIDDGIRHCFESWLHLLKKVLYLRERAKTQRIRWKTEQ